MRVRSVQVSVGHREDDQGPVPAEVCRSPSLGRNLLTKLTPMQTQAHYAQSMQSGRKDGKRRADLSSATVLQHHRVLHKALECAVKWQIVARNAADVVDLRMHRVGQRQERWLAGEAYADHGLVFATAVGSPLDPSRIGKVFRRILEQAGLPNIRFHDLRHTHASLMLKAGVHPKIVSERLGHAAIGITLDTYSHVLPNLQEEAARKLDEQLFGTAPSKERQGRN